MTQAGVPVYLRDIADVKDTTEDLRSFTRINGKPGVRLQRHQAVGQEHRRRSPTRVRAEIARINREVPGVQLTRARRQLDVHRASIARGQGSRLVGAFLVDR